MSLGRKRRQAVWQTLDNPGITLRALSAPQGPPELSPAWDFRGPGGGYPRVWSDAVLIARKRRRVWEG
jgi:hypothetical protein